MGAVGPGRRIKVTPEPVKTPPPERAPVKEPARPEKVPVGA